MNEKQPIMTIENEPEAKQKLREFQTKIYALLKEYPQISICGDRDGDPIAQWKYNSYVKPETIYLPFSADDLFS